MSTARLKKALAKERSFLWGAPCGTAFGTVVGTLVGVLKGSEDARNLAFAYAAQNGCLDQFKDLVRGGSKAVLETCGQACAQICYAARDLLNDYGSASYKNGAEKGALYGAIAAAGICLIAFGVTTACIYSRTSANPVTPAPRDEESAESVSSSKSDPSVTSSTSSPRSKR